MAYSMVKARTLNAVYVANKYYSELVVSEVHPGNLGPLPPSPARIMRSADLLGIVSQEHRWTLLWL